MEDSGNIIALNEMRLLEMHKIFINCKKDYQPFSDYNDSHASHLNVKLWLNFQNSVMPFITQEK